MKPNDIADHIPTGHSVQIISVDETHAWIREDAFENQRVPLSELRKAEPVIWRDSIQEVMVLEKEHWEKRCPFCGLIPCVCDV